MFQGLLPSIQNIGGWNVGNVQNMTSMFEEQYLLPKILGTGMLLM